MRYYMPEVVPVRYFYGVKAAGRRFESCPSPPKGLVAQMAERRSRRQLF